MRVTRDTLREMILAELAAMEEQGGLVGRSEPRGIPGTPPEMLKLKAGGLSSQMRDFIDALVDAGWEEDQLRAALANMDNDVLASILGPALRESANVTGADILRILREAVAWSEAEEQDANLFWDAWKSAGIQPRDYGTREAILDAWIAADRPIPVATWLAQPETQQVLADLGYIMSQAMLGTLNIELAPVAGPDPTLLSEPEAAGDPQFPEDWKPRTRDLHETVLMTVGQFRRLVREAAGGSSNLDVKMHLDDLRNMGYSAGGILDGLRDMVYYDEGLKKLDDWLEGQAQVPEWPLLRNWLDHLGPEEAEDDLNMLLRALRPPADPHPAEDQYRDSVAAEDTREQVRDDIANLLAANPTGPNLKKLKELEELYKYASNEELDYIVTELMDFPESVFAEGVETSAQARLNESTIMTLGQFRKLIREASYDWDPFDSMSRRKVARQLINDTKPMDYSIEKWEELLREYLSATTWFNGAPEVMPETDMMNKVEATIADAAEGKVNPGILKTAMLNMLSGA